MNLSFYKICCKITAIGNIIAAVLAMVSMSNHLEMFYGNVSVNPIFQMYHYGFWTFVLTMGIAYWELAKKPFELRIIALMGAIGKFVLVGFWLNLLLAGQAKPMLWTGVVYDLFFGAVLAVLYWKTRGKNE